MTASDLAAELDGRIGDLRRARVQHQAEMDQVRYAQAALEDAERAVGAAERAICELIERAVGVPHASLAQCYFG